MHAISFRLSDESVESQQQAGRYNPAQVCHFRIGAKHVSHTIGAGRSDDISVFTHGGLGVILTYNRRLDYVGLEVVDSAGTLVGDVFLQGQEHYKITLGPKGLDLRETTIATRLMEYIG